MFSSWSNDISFSRWSAAGDGNPAGTLKEPRGRRMPPSAIGPREHANPNTIRTILNAIRLELRPNQAPTNAVKLEAYFTESKLGQNADAPVSAALFTLCLRLLLRRPDKPGA